MTVPMEPAVKALATIAHNLVRPDAVALELEAASAVAAFSWSILASLRDGSTTVQGLSEDQARSLLEILTSLPRRPFGSLVEVEGALVELTGKPFPREEGSLKCARHPGVCTDR